MSQIYQLHTGRMNAFEKAKHHIEVIQDAERTILQVTVKTF